MTYQQVWLRRLSVAIAKQDAIATLVRVPLVTRQASMGEDVLPALASVSRKLDLTRLAYNLR